MRTGDSEHDRSEIRGLIFYFPGLGIACSYIFMIIELIVGFSSFALEWIFFRNFIDLTEIMFKLNQRKFNVAYAIRNVDSKKQN